MLVGGAPLNEEFGKAVGADAYCRDAAVAAETAKALVLARRARQPPRPPRCSTTEVGRCGAEPRRRADLLACGALAREMLAVIRLNGWTHVDVRCLPAKLHIDARSGSPAAVDAKLDGARGRYEPVFVAYADCGTGGRARRRARAARRRADARVPTATSFFAGNDAWDAMQEDEPGTFYLTDFLARHFDALVVRGLGLDRHPQLLPQMFGNYRRLVLSRADRRRRRCDAGAGPRPRLGLAFEHRRTGYGELDAVARRRVARVMPPRGLS